MIQRSDTEYQTSGLQLCAQADLTTAQIVFVCLRVSAEVRLMLGCVLNSAAGPWDAPAPALCARCHQT